MKNSCIVWGVGGAIVAASWLWTLPVEAATKAEQARSAAKLVEDTLRREATDGVDDRAELLKPVLGQARPCEAAYWQSGFLYDSKRKEWLRWDEVQQRAAEDDRLATYREIRPKYPETEDGQAELARWCAKRKLEDQARAHWTKVSSLAPDQPEARVQLGFRMVNGTWLGQQEIADARAQIDNIQAAIERWAPKLEELLKKLEGSNRRACELAREKLTAIKDPDVAPAIEAIFCTEGGETALLGIEVLKNMKATEAAQSLAWQAVFSPGEPIRAAAAAALKEQRKHDYVPLLLGALRTPIQARYELYDSPDGGFLMRRALYQDGPEQRELAVSVVAKPAVLLPSGRSVGPFELQANPSLRQDVRRLSIEDQQRQLTKLAVARAKALTQARRQQAAIAAGNLSTANVNSRLCSVLAETTGDAQPQSPDDWYSWWNNYNEITTQGDKPMKVVYQVSNEPIVTIAQAPTLRRFSCLVAGTPVWTELGAVPVEQVKVGDRVLACDCQSGQIMLKPVLKTIVNPKTPLFSLHTVGETLEVTGGHVFWVSGQGWVKARELQPQMRLHTLKGTVDLESVEPGGKQDTYNLVVADFHTYFAGTEKILTHDNTIRKPTNCVVPGLAAHVADASP
jgi:hypothetical protein